MIDEEYPDHLCEPRIGKFKKIQFTSYSLAKTNEGKTLLDITALDGTSYLFEEVPEHKIDTKIHYQPIGNRSKYST